MSDRSLLGWCRDVFFGPLGKVPGARGPMLSILTGEAGHRRKPQGEDVQAEELPAP